MIAAYVAVPLVGEDSFVAHDLSTTFAFEVGPGAERLVTDPDGELVGAAVTNYLPPQSLPDFYAFTIATRYLPLDTLAL